MTRQDVLSTDPADYAAAEALLKNFLKNMGNDATWYCNSFNPYPFVITQEELYHQERLQSCLNRAIRAVVENYAKDRRIQALLSVSEPVAALIEQVQSQRRYEIGSYRPDFLHDTKGGLKVCEINARFPINGYYISHYLGKCTTAMPYIPERLVPIRTLDDVIVALTERFQPGSEVAVIKGREKGWDINFFKHELAGRGLQYKELTPEECHLAINSDGYVLELHQDELTDRLEAIMDAIGSKPGFNDIRTIFLVHDKRLLAILHDDSIMADYADEDDRRLLKSNVAESHVLSSAPDIVSEAKRDRRQWVVKPNLLGKGEGMLIGAHSTQPQWERALDNPAHCNFVLQRFVEQKKFPILLRIEDRVQESSLNVVGTLLCFDQQFFGPGIYRASQSDIVNVAGGGAILFPMLTEGRYPK